MTIEDQIAAMFARANPVPSLDLLDPVESVDIDRLTDESERSSRMSEIHTIEPELDKEPRRRPAFGLVAAGIITVAAVVVIIALANREPEVVATPVEVAESFLEARNAHDAEAMMSLLAEDAVIDDRAETVDDYPPQIELERAQGWSYEVGECVGGTAQIRCPYAFSTASSRALGVGPYNGSGSFHFWIEDGKIQRVTHVQAADNLYNREVGDVFLAWMEENHPGVADDMYRFDPASLAKWEQYVPEFVAAMEGSG